MLNEGKLLGIVELPSCNVPMCHLKISSWNAGSFEKCSNAFSFHWGQTSTQNQHKRRMFLSNHLLKIFFNIDYKNNYYFVSKICISIEYNTCIFKWYFWTEQYHKIDQMIICSMFSSLHFLSFRILSDFCDELYSMWAA